MPSRTNRTIVFLSVMPLLIAVCVHVASQTPIIIQRQQPQTPPPPPKPVTVPDAIGLVTSGDFSGPWLDMIARAKAVEAVPALKGQFLRVQNSDTKAHIASVLVRLGDRDEVYWDFLTDYATRAVEVNAPDLQHYDQEGKPLSDPSPAFIAWAGANQLTVNTAMQQEGHLEAAIIFLASTGDPRAAPLLRRGLLSSDYLIAANSAQGLAEAKDADSVPLIIDACRRAPPAWQGAIAQSLAYFDDPDAQRAVDQYVPKDMASALRAEHAKGKTPFR